MNRYTPKHAAPARSRRRLAASTGALITGAAVALGTAGIAEAKVTQAIPSGDLYDNCDSGFTGSFTVTDKQVTVSFDPHEDFVGGEAGIDVRGTAKDARQRARTFRLKEEYAVLTDGWRTKTFTLPAGGYVWRVGVTAIKPGELEDTHALDHEQGPCE